MYYTPFEIETIRKIIKNSTPGWTEDPKWPHKNILNKLDLPNAAQSASQKYPRLNVYKTKLLDGILVSGKQVLVIDATVPGMTIDDISLTIKGDVLYISGVSKNEKTNEKQDYITREIKQSAFERSVDLSEYNFDPNLISSSLKLGLLHIRIPLMDKGTNNVFNVKINNDNTLK